MKRFLLAGVFALSFNANANLLEDAADFYINLMSGGTFLADLEGEKKQIELQMEKKKAQLLVDASEEAKKAQIKFYFEKQKDYQSFLAKEKEILSKLSEFSEEFSISVGALKNVYIASKKTGLQLQILRQTSQEFTEQMQMIAEVALGEVSLLELRETCKQKKESSDCIWIAVWEAADEIRNSEEPLDTTVELKALVDVMLRKQFKLDETKGILSEKIRQIERTLEEGKQVLVSLGATA